MTDTAVGLINHSGKFVLDLSDTEIRCRYSEQREVPELAKKFDLTAEQKCLSSLTFLFGASETPEFPEDDSEHESVTLMELINY